ncbi:MAG: sulfotransferase [Gammaproteobacteria bacterium]
MQENRDKRQLIIGCGTGRCGTVSLVKILNSQAGISVLHEGVTSDRRFHHLVPWYEGETQLWSWLTELEALTNNAKWYGDVGPYFLPYLPKLFKRYPASRAICLERNRKEVIRSYLQKTEGRNHWYRYKGVGWAEDPEWDHAFPDYAEPDKSKALGLYWDQYHCTASEYCALYPDNFILLPMTALNETNGRLKILKFIGYDGPGMFEGRFHANESYKNRLRKSLMRLSSLFRANDHI